jgi:hypothetical protein
LDEKKYPCQNLSLKDINGEIWKEISETEYYLISNYGRVKSLPRYIEVEIVKRNRSICYLTKERIRKIKIHTKWNSIVKQAYYECTISLPVGGEEKTFLIHRLVYSAFIRPVDFNKDELVVMHKDGDGLNNHVENLQAAHRSDAMKNSYSKQRHISPFAWKTKNEMTQIVAKAASSRQKPVIQKSLDGKNIRTFESIAEASKNTGIPDSNIVRVLKKDNYQAGGFLWEYLLKD